jgi:hypothetical protein
VDCTYYAGVATLGVTGWKGAARDMYFFENAHNRIHLNYYCSNEILSYYYLNKHSGRQEEGRIEGMTVERKEGVSLAIVFGL